MTAFSGTEEQMDGFDAEWYRTFYSDVDESGLSPAEHYRRIGQRLGRHSAPPTGQFFANSPDCAATKSEIEIFDSYAPYSVDIIIPVFNALIDVKNCIYSILWHRCRCKLHLIIIDDGSDKETQTWLENIASKPYGLRISMTLIRKDQNEGYTRAINSGLTQSNGDFVVTQNSDTIVTRDWIERLIRCIKADPDTGIVGPLSNAASWQNVPELRDEAGNFAVNTLPDGMTADGMAAVVADCASHSYPEVPFLNGFCFMISRAVINAVGHMDDINFPIGYGEENDFCIRALNAGFKLRVCDDAYVYHAKSKSFGHSKRAELSKLGSENLRRKHGDDQVNRLLRSIKNNKQLEVCRTDVSTALATHMKRAAENSYSLLPTLRIVFVLPVSGGGGGGHSVVQEVCEMRALGLDARIAIPKQYIAGFSEKYPALSNDQDIFIQYENETLSLLLRSFDCIVATVFTSVSTLAKSSPKKSYQTHFYYAQDFEPMFFELHSKSWIDAMDSYCVNPDQLIFAKTDWICENISNISTAQPKRVIASVDHSIYFPKFQHRNWKQGKELSIAAMIRPSTPYRGAERTLNILEKVKRLVSEQISVKIFGCSSDDTLIKRFSETFLFENRGILVREQVSDLLREADIFIDLSDYQAFGRTGIEAMASGCAVISTKHGGIREYITEGVNAFLVDPESEEECVAAIVRLVQDKALLSQFKINGLKTSLNFSCRRAAFSELEVFANHHSRNLVCADKIKSKRLVIVPSTPSHNPGEVSYTGTAFVRLLYPYIDLENGRSWSTCISSSGRLPRIDAGDVALIQRDLPNEGLENFSEWASQWKASGGKIVYDIDDDLLDGDALKERGYKEDVNALAKRVTRYCESADVITCSTTQLANRLKHYSAKTVVVPNFLDSELWKLSIPRPLKVDRQLRIGYFGTPTHNDDLAIVCDAMKAIEKSHGITTEVIGAFQNTPPLFGKKIPLPKNSIYPVFSDWLLQVADWDIAIIPLADSPFNRSKSNLKFLECSALGAAIICSDTPEYRKVARHRDNCLMVSNDTQSWLAGLTELIESADLRRRLAQQARNDLTQRWTIQKNRHVYEAVLAKALGSGG